MAKKKRKASEILAKSKIQPNKLSAKPKPQQAAKAQAETRQTPKTRATPQTKRRAPTLDPEEKKIRDKKRAMAAIPFAIAVLIFVSAWATEPVKVVDPWYEAILLVDSSTRIKDPKLRLETREEGGQKLRELVKEHPYHARVHHLLGIYYAIAGKWDSAIVEQKIAIDKGAGGLVNQVEFAALEQLTQAAMNQSNILLQKKLNDSARALLDEVLTYNDKNGKIYFQIGTIFHRKNNIDSAIFYYNKAVKFDPKYGPAKTNLSLVYFARGNQKLNQGKFNSAEKDFLKAIEYNPRNANFHNNLGAVYMNLGEYDKAARQYQKAVEINPSTPNAQRNLQAALQKSRGNN